MNLTIKDMDVSIAMIHLSQHKIDIYKNVRKYSCNVKEMNSNGIGLY